MLEHARKPLRISLTPLIDVVFILLLFFMLSTNFMHWQQLTMSSVAKGKPRVLDRFPKQLFALGDGSVRHAGRIYHLHSPELDRLLQGFLAEDAHLIVTAESRATIQDVVLVMDNIVDAGIENVSLTNSFDER